MIGGGATGEGEWAVGGGSVNGWGREGEGE